MLGAVAQPTTAGLKVLLLLGAHGHVVEWINQET